MVQYFRSKTTNAIHRVGDFPWPKRDGFTQCGLYEVSKLTQLTPQEVKEAPSYEFCITCRDLAGS